MELGLKLRTLQIVLRNMERSEELQNANKELLKGATEVATENNGIVITYMVKE